VGAVPATSRALAPWTPRAVTRLDGLPNRPQHYEHEPDEGDREEKHASQGTARDPPLDSAKEGLSRSAHAREGAEAALPLRREGAGQVRAPRREDAKQAINAGSSATPTPELIMRGAKAGDHPRPLFCGPFSALSGVGTMGVSVPAGPPRWCRRAGLRRLLRLRRGLAFFGIHRARLASLPLRPGSG
jgi:hypothetical protein